MQLTTDKGPFNSSLRNACLGLAVFLLFWLVFGVIFRSSYTTTLVGFIFEIICNVSLLFGVLMSNQWLVLVWLIGAIIFFINWPIAFLGVIFNFGPYRAIAIFDNVFLILIEYIILLIVALYCARLVYSMYEQLRSSTTNPQHAVVV